MDKYARVAIIILLKGIFYKEEDEKAWSQLIENSYGVIKEYFAVIGLDVLVDESEGYAYLKNSEQDDNEADIIPKVIAKRELSYKVSLLCVLLRKEIVNFDMQNENSRAIISREDIGKEMLLYLPQKYNEVKVFKEIDSTIKKVEELGFLKKLKNSEESYEIKRSIKAFVDASWLSDFDVRMGEYKESGRWN
jgi:hypothetical protein